MSFGSVEEAADAKVRVELQQTQLSTDLAQRNRLILSFAEEATEKGPRPLQSVRDNAQDVRQQTGKALCSAVHGPALHAAMQYLL